MAYLLNVFLFLTKFRVRIGPDLVIPFPDKAVEGFKQLAHEIALARDELGDRVSLGHLLHYLSATVQGARHPVRKPEHAVDNNGRRHDQGDEQDTLVGKVFEI